MGSSKKERGEEMNWLNHFATTISIDPDGEDLSPFLLRKPSTSILMLPRMDFSVEFKLRWALHEEDELRSIP